MDKVNFIYTSDKDTAEQLELLGYEQLPNQGKLYVFLNEEKDTLLTFEKNGIDIKKLITSNMFIL